MCFCKWCVFIFLIYFFIVNPYCVTFMKLKYSFCIVEIPLFHGEQEINFWLNYKSNFLHVFLKNSNKIFYSKWARLFSIDSICITFKFIKHIECLGTCIWTASYTHLGIVALDPSVQPRCASQKISPLKFHLKKCPFIMKRCFVVKECLHPNSGSQFK